MEALGNDATPTALVVPMQSPVPDALDASTCSSDTAPMIAEKAQTCPIRASGQVCICDLCEAARLRLLHRRNLNDTIPLLPIKRKEIPLESAQSHKKRSRDNSITENEGDEAEVKALEIQSLKADTDPEEVKLHIMSQACRTILECIGEDPNREGLRKTPERWAKALLFLCHGYHLTPSQITNDAIFYENHNEMVVVRNIDIHSLCEHHMLPFTGHVHIGYIPNGAIIGLSKLARLADCFARRLQVQERLTRQIADALVDMIHPLGVAVVMECTHDCMVLRGVQKTGTRTTTSSVRGCFESNSKTRAEFFSILHGGK
jgi:GTP cyclohydrolase IA